MTIPISGNLTSNFTRETDQEQVKRGASQSSSRAILTKDSLEVPFEKQVSIQSQEAEAGRPFLPPLFRMRFVEDRQVEDLSHDYYQTLRNSLPLMLKAELEKSETEALAERDPNLVALDTSLKFEANLLALADMASVPIGDKEKALIGAQQYIALPDLVQQELLTYGASVVRFLDHYLSSIDRNDASYEMLVNVSNQMKEALELLNLNRETTTP